jgi:plastocyanin
MKYLTLRSSFQRLLVLAALATPTIALAQSWQAAVGGQNHSQGMQALAFLPNEMWIHAGDDITWTFITDEPHTVSFLTPGQVRPPFVVGCPGTTPSGLPFDDSACVNSGVSASGQDYTVTFPTAGNFKLVCLLHENMTALVHVLDSSQPLPHDQTFYDREAARELHELLSDAEQQMDHGEKNAHPNAVIAGAGAIVANAGGSQTASVMRFMQPNKVIRVGGTVEWTNSDPITPHTITFGTEPLDPMPPSSNVTLDPDGARHAEIGSTSDSVHSGFISAAPQDQIGLPQPSPGVTRLRVTFTKPGVYHYICALHDGLGMVGVVIVRPW